MNAMIPGYYFARSNTHSHSGITALDQNYDNIQARHFAPFKGGGWFNFDFFLWQLGLGWT